jgi:hypothetical protein
MCGCASQYQQLWKVEQQKQNSERIKEEQKKIIHEKKMEVLLRENEESLLKFEEKRLALINSDKSLSEEEKKNLIAGEFWIGMTRNQAYGANFARTDESVTYEPLHPKIRRTEYSWGVHEQWEVYKYPGFNIDSSKRQFLYFENGILTVIQDI